MYIYTLTAVYVIINNDMRCLDPDCEVIVELQGRSNESYTTTDKLAVIVASSYISAYVYQSVWVVSVCYCKATTLLLI